jgi:hypothetical protein
MSTAYVDLRSLYEWVSSSAPLTHDDESDNLTDMTTKRLQVLMDEAELKRIQRLARREHVTTAEWVRQRLREAQDERGRPDTAAKLAAIQTAYRFQPPAPAPDIEQMLAEIEAGYLDDPSMS